MRQRVAIVTDSTASIPADVASKLHLPVVQLELRIGDEHNDE
ncbi:MAG: DegV family protein, partial [Saccharopolyspora rectivirgula]